VLDCSVWPETFGIVLAALPGLILVVLGLPTAVVAAIVGRLS